MKSETSIGYLLGRMLPELPPIPVDEPTLTTDGEGTAIVEWRREYAVGDDGRMVIAGDEVKTIERPGRVVITARIERGDAA